MKQKTKQLIMTLVALLALTTHAWAQEQSETIATTDDHIVEGTHFTISNGESWVDDDGMSATSGITVTPKNGETITKVVISCTYQSYNVNDGITSVSSGKKEITNSGGTITVTGVNASTFTFTCSDSGPQFIQFVIYYTPPPTVPLNWNATTKTATLTNGMPAGNVTVNVEYFAQAEFAMSTDATPVALAPAPIAGVKATTDEDIITAGTVADIANTTTKQGTLMYYVSEEQLTDAQLVALADQGKFSADVPKATDLTQEGNVYVYYYIQGAEPATIAERTDANTCSDSDIKALTVTIGAAPLWNAEFDLTDAPEEDKAPGVWTTDIPKEGVVKGTPVTVTYTGDRKVIGVKAEKKASTPTLKDALADGATVVITYTWTGNETTFTYTNNGGNYTGNTTGFDAPSFANGMSKDGTTLKFTATNQDTPDANVSIDFYTDTNEYFVTKGSLFTSFTISVNGTDLTSQLTKVK